MWRKRISLAICLMSSIAVASAADDPAAGRSKFAQLDDLKIHYTDYGQGAAALVFVHGWSCDETVWKEQPSAFVRELRTITVDLPGHGQSDKPQIAYTMQLYARALDAVLRDAGVNSAVLVGHSNGAIVIRQFYRDFRAKAGGLIIVDGSLRQRADAAAMERFIAPLRGPDYPKTAAAAIDGMTRVIEDEELRARIKTTILATPQHVSISELESTLDPDLWKPDAIDVPILMLLAQQPMWNADYEKFARTLVPNLDYEVWDNVSHFLMMERPEEFNAAVLKFLRKHLFLHERS